MYEKYYDYIFRLGGYDCDYEEIYKFADDYLYEAKRDGRNSIYIKNEK